MAAVTQIDGATRDRHWSDRDRPGALWAPLAQDVRIVVRPAGDGDPGADPAEHVMTQGEGGWWWSPVPIPPGTDYGFRLDGEDAVLPDPRSRWQPEGVHGMSRAFDPGAHRWHDDGWRGRPLAGSVLYELHLGTFTAEGTLDAAIERLDHLVDLGIDAVELLPVNAFNGTHNWGYDGVLWFAVAASYGGPAAYQRFVDACHARGLAVVQDVVYNHLGPSGNYLPRFAPYLHDEASNSWGSSIALAEPEVRRYILDNASMWFRDFHVDALRLDAVHALHDETPTHILRELSDEIDALAAALRRPLTLIAESDLNDPSMVTPREAGGLGIHAQWSDDFHHAVHVAVTGETSGYYADFEKLDALAKVCTSGFFHDGTYSSFRGRFHGSPIDVDTFAAWRLVVADQNHDQIGNRAAGDRLSATVDAGGLAIAAVLTLTSPFTPMLFMGEEWGATTPWQFFTSHPEPELGRATAEGRIAEFAQMGWDPAQVPDPQDPETFRRSKLDWSELDRPANAALLDVYRRLIALRRTTPAITDPRLTRTRVDHDAAARWLVLRRGVAPSGGRADEGTDASEVAICVNLGTEPVSLPWRGTLAIATDPGVGGAQDGTGGIVLPPRSAGVLLDVTAVRGDRVLER